MAAKKKRVSKKKTASKTRRKAQPVPRDEDLQIPQTTGAALAAPVVEGLQGARLRTAVSELMAQENERREHKVMAFAADAPNTYELRRPSGIMNLDLDTGGGPPAGGLTYISGPDNAGKTYLILLYMYMCQLLYGERCALAFACVEGGFDFKRALNVGLKIAVPDYVIQQWDVERQLRGFPPYTKEEWLSFKEQIGQFALIAGNTGEEILGTVLEVIRSKLFQIVAVDSISIIMPEADADKELEDPNKVAAQASLVTDFIRKYTPLTSGLDELNHTTLLFSAQVRANQERARAPSHMQKYLKQWATTGAHAARHGKLLDIIVWSGGKITKQIHGQKTVVGKSTHYEIAKGKAGAHDNVVGEFPFYYDSYLPQGVDRVESVMIEGMKAGVIVEHNGLVSVVQPETKQPGEIHGVPGLPTFKRMMEVDLEFELAVRREVLASRGIQCLYR